MSEHRLELADVFRTYGDNFLALWERVLSRPQRKAFDVRKQPASNDWPNGMLSCCR